MKNIHKNKSRTRLYNALMGAEVLTGEGGRSAVGSLVLDTIPLADETIIIGDYYFAASDSATEAAGTSAGTAADPHLFLSETDVATAGASLAACILQETATTGAWGYLYPDDSVGCDFTTATLTLTFWPGTAGNDVTLGGTAADGTITQPVTASLGSAAPTVSVNHAYTIIDSTGGTDNKEYWTLEDGSDFGDTVTVVINGMEASDTPTVIGHLSENGVAMVEMEFITAELGASATLMWDGAVWEMINYNPLHTVPDFTAA